ncbi:DUF6783 domain-containing protein [Enterocloster lavalensis]|uniref:DUF6783 domain-containing protein n=1 Tax=Enterocloster lavalensis TaxID=460384 RepID=UPI002AA5B3D3|nr:DUF6783 domain-containing protein [Enterocloster lavalensis]
MCVTLCGRFGPDEGGVAGYVDRIGTKYTAKWGVHMVEMNFQTHPRTALVFGKWDGARGKRKSGGRQNRQPPLMPSCKCLNW